MAFCRAKLVEKILRKKIYLAVENILAIIRQGFDVHVVCEFEEVEASLLVVLREELEVHSSAFFLVTNEADLVGNMDADVAAPMIFVQRNKICAGMGFIRYVMPTADALLPSVASTVETVLEHFGLDTYLDCFDARLCTALKRLSRVQGISVLIDCIVQTAYLAGYKGDVDLAFRYLESQTSIVQPMGKTDFSLEKSAKIFLGHVCGLGENAHAFLKSSLSYFMVTNQGHTMTKASQLLSISRTTLQEHLKLAQELGVASFFDGILPKLSP